MSRIGKKPIPIPSGIDVKVEKNSVSVKGPKGELKQDFHPKVGVKVESGNILVSRSSDDRFDRALHGLTRSIIANMITGVTKGYEKSLEISGVGYRAQVQGKQLVMTLGFSHPVNFELPNGIEAVVDKQTNITIKGIDKYLVGQTAANIRSLKKPEPYKGKGIKYADEHIRRKEGKTGKGK
ncbi:MAG: 50S ribosomal protein L6 [Nitrospirae bacterium]|nr:50S ribosomal protein L6 [Nitrospirota bacterium]